MLASGESKWRLDGKMIKAGEEEVRYRESRCALYFVRG
jgi:hypothetical protein